MFSPALGRFTTSDPIGFSGGDINLYRYVGNKSVSLIDPSGRGALDFLVLPVASGAGTLMLKYIIGPGVQKVSNNYFSPSPSPTANGGDQSDSGGSINSPVPSPCPNADDGGNQGGSDEGDSSGDTSESDGGN